jgi:hypothetical protein
LSFSVDKIYRQQYIILMAISLQRARCPSSHAISDHVSGCTTGDGNMDQSGSGSVSAWKGINFWMDGNGRSDSDPDTDPDGDGTYFQ